jgi:hypothetical protein
MQHILIKEYNNHGCLKKERKNKKRTTIITQGTCMHHILIINKEYIIMQGNVKRKLKADI